MQSMEGSPGCTHAKVYDLSTLISVQYWVRVSRYRPPGDFFHPSHGSQPAPSSTKGPQGAPICIRLCSLNSSNVPWWFHLLDNNWATLPGIPSEPSPHLFQFVKSSLGICSKCPRGLGSPSCVLALGLPHFNSCHNFLSMTYFPPYDYIALKGWMGPVYPQSLRQLMIVQ